MRSNRSFTRRQFANGGGPSDIMQRVAKAVHLALPKGWGFTVLAFPLDSRDGGVRYVANADKESVLKLLREFVAKQDAKPPTAGPEGN